MKKSWIGMAGLAVVAVFLTAHEGYLKEEKGDIQKSLSFGAAAGAREVVVDNIFGSIRVEGYSGSTVELKARKTISGRSQEKIQKAKGEVELKITENGNTIDIYVDGPFRCHDGRGHQGWRDPGYEVQYDFELRVPFRTNLCLSTVNEGDIEVNSVEGDFDVHNVNGKIRMFRLAGSGSAHTVNGEVMVGFKKSPEKDCSFKTINGEVEVAFPENPSADFRVKTFNGDVYTDFPVTSLPAKTASAERKNGKYVYKSDRFFGVRSGKGGPEIMLDTLNGDIYIKKGSD